MLLLFRPSIRVTFEARGYTVLMSLPAFIMTVLGTENIMYPNNFYHLYTGENF